VLNTYQINKSLPDTVEPDRPCYMLTYYKIYYTSPRQGPGGLGNNVVEMPKMKTA